LGTSGEGAFIALRLTDQSLPAVASVYPTRVNAAGELLQISGFSFGNDSTVLRVFFTEDLECSLVSVLQFNETSLFGIISCFTPLVPFQQLGTYRVTVMLDDEALPESDYNVTVQVYDVTINSLYPISGPVSLTPKQKIVSWQMIWNKFPKLFEHRRSLMKRSSLSPVKIFSHFFQTLRIPSLLSVISFIHLTFPRIMSSTKPAMQL
jgi:hypothetical protein